MWLLFAPFVLADIPPYDGQYVAPTCTVELACAADQDGVLCGDAYYGAPEACAARWQSQGYTKACRGGGASTWDEVWCRPKDYTPPPEPAVVEPVPEPEVTPPQPAPAPVPPVTKDSSGCSHVPSASWLGVLLPLALVRRRS